MSVGNFGMKGKALTRKRFFLLLNYLKNFGIKDYIKGSVEKKIKNNRKQSLINWVEFDLQPTQMSNVYRILIIYIEGQSPYAYILSPSLNCLKEEGRKIPHLYDHDRFLLCLHYPYTDDYSSKEEIGQQYIPWIIHWLYYFEEWVYSDEWKGRGVEPGDVIDKKHNPKYKEGTKPELANNDDKYNASLEEANKIYDRRIEKLLSEEK